jgi:transcriptional regulator GlxA family with amidase domain
MPNAAPHHFRFVLFDGFSNLVLASAMEPLRDVRTRMLGAAPSWSVETLSGQAVRSSSGLSISPSAAPDGPIAGQTTILVSGYGARIHATGATLSRIRQLAHRSDRMIGLDAGAWLMAAAGLLDGHDATLHWQEFDDFQEAFPRVNLSRKSYVISGRMMTCGGASSALDLILHLIKAQFGAVAAFDTSRMFLYDPDQPPRREGPLRHSPPALLRAINAMAETVEQPLSLPQICIRARTSERTLHRLFNQELNIAPGRYHQLLRLGRARDLATESKLSVAEIALRCGFSSAPALSRAFTMTFGTSIRKIRKPHG